MVDLPSNIFRCKKNLFQDSDKYYEAIVGSRLEFSYVKKQGRASSFERPFEVLCSLGQRQIKVTHPSFDLKWLETTLYTMDEIGDESFTKAVIFENIISILTTSSEEAQLESSLIDLMGYSFLDLIGQILQHKNSILASISQKNLAKLSLDDKQDKGSTIGSGGGSTKSGYPFVYAKIDPFSTTENSGTQHKLPKNCKHTNDTKSEEFFFPYEKASVEDFGIKTVQIREFPFYFQPVFKDYLHLNKVQSAVFPCAFYSNENMLVCAPTGAGKTDVAMLVILKVLQDHLTISPSDWNDVKSPSVSSSDVIQPSVKVNISTEDFKIIYISPMKALASEIVSKFSKRLAPLKINVREYTGDIQLNRRQIEQTQILVSTPEKWDVVTRKGFTDMKLIQKVQLIIIDEVHLLHDDRGPVLESLVARTLRMVEKTQKIIRIVGLSATLPNFIDVSDFLRVNPQKGLFYFDASFRPVPLSQKFIGIKKAPAVHQVMNEVCFEESLKCVKNNFQAMVFVHSRNDTLKTAKLFCEFALERNLLGYFETALSPALVKDLQAVSSKELQALLRQGFAVHHAGLSRGDRNTVERWFIAGYVRVLCCTATLAWGVNLPAHSVIIKGTQVYDNNKGGFGDLSILDVVQIFGRAGRPQYETHGEAILITSHDKLSHYLRALTQPLPIESRFLEHIGDHLNAEIYLGTVSNMSEAFSWLKYTYLWIRMKKNPLSYGISWGQLAKDPQLENTCKEILEVHAVNLNSVGMIRYEPLLEEPLFKSLELGRICSVFYLNFSTVQAFTSRLHAFMSDSEILSLICSASEFQHLKIRESDNLVLAQLIGKKNLMKLDVEMVANFLYEEKVNSRAPKAFPGSKNPSKELGKELKDLKDIAEDWNSDFTWCPIPIIDDINSIAGKVNVLVQAYISNWNAETSNSHKTSRNHSGPGSSSLSSDLQYVSQNCGRLFRAVFEIALTKGWVETGCRLLEFCKAFEKRFWMDSHPLCQFNLSAHLTQKLQSAAINRVDMEALKEIISQYDEQQTGQNSDKTRLVAQLVALIGSAVPEHQQLASAIRRFPQLAVNYELIPITCSILRINVGLNPDFDLQGNPEAFWIWLVDPKHLDQISYYEYVLINQQGQTSSLTNSLKDRNHIGKYGLNQKKWKLETNDQLDLKNEPEENDEGLSSNSCTVLSFVLPVPQPPPRSLELRVLSDHWVGANTLYSIPLDDVIWPDLSSSDTYFTELLDLHPLPVSCLNNSELEAYYKNIKGLDYFNAIQSQVFHRLYHSHDNILLGAPTGSGKTVVAELALWNLYRGANNGPQQSSAAKAVYIAPLKALIKERLTDWKDSFKSYFGLSVVELTGDLTPSSSELLNAHLIVTTPEKWDGISRHWKYKSYVQNIGLVIIDEIHLLNGDRGPVLESIVSRMRFMDYNLRQERFLFLNSIKNAYNEQHKEKHSGIRWIGLSTALANPFDLSEWLNVPWSGLFNFRGSVRPIPLALHISGFSGKHYCSRMETMNKPCYEAILTHSPQKPVLIFVSSRRQTRLTSQGLIFHSSIDDVNTNSVESVTDEPLEKYMHNKRFLKMREEEFNEQILPFLSDPTLKHLISHGIGIHHAGILESDRKIVEALFKDGKIQVLVATSTLAWGLNFPARLVIVKGTEYYESQLNGYLDYSMTDVLQMIGRAGRPGYDVEGVAVIFTSSNKKNYFKKLLYEAFPVESSILNNLEDLVGPEIVEGMIHSKEDLLAYFSWTFLSKRLAKNPCYYNYYCQASDKFESLDSEKVKAGYYDRLVERVLRKLSKADYIQVNRELVFGEEVHESSTYQGKALGRIASKYYVSFKTLGHWKDQISNINPSGERTMLETFRNILILLSYSSEYEKIPLRHNEDVLLHELESQGLLFIKTRAKEKERQTGGRK